MASTPPQDYTTDASTASPLPSDASPSHPAPILHSSSYKQAKSERERLSRKKRLDKTKAMRTQIEALERTELALRVAPDADTIWDEFLDDDTKRVRGSLRRLVTVAGEAERLTRENTQLQRRLARHELAREAIESLISAMDDPTDWGIRASRWRALASLHFRRLTTGQANNIKKEALKEMDKFLLSQDKQTTGMSMMGWRDSRRLLPKDSSLQFNLTKTYQGYDLNHHIDMMWRVFSEQELYAKVVVGRRGHASVDIVQQLSPTMWVVRFDEQYNEMDVAIHELYLLFRIEAEHRVIQYLYAFEDKKLHDAMNTPRDMWTSNYYWMQWDVLDKTRDWSSTDYRVSVGGCLRGADPAFLHHWLFELFAMLVRSEGVATDKPLLDFS